MSSTSARKAGSRRLRGCGRVTLISAEMRPGLEASTRMRSDISTASSMLCVTSRIEEIGAQRLGGQHVECREGLVHQQQARMHDQRPREADALAHAARQLLRIGALVAVEAD